VKLLSGKKAPHPDRGLILFWSPFFSSPLAHHPLVPLLLIRPVLLKPGKGTIVLIAPRRFLEVHLRPAAIIASNILEAGMVVAEFSIVPLVEGSLRSYVKVAVAEIDKSGLKYEVDAMGTTLEGDLDDVMTAIMNAHRAVLAAGAGRVVTSIKIDERPGELSMDGKLKGFR